ncbi:tetratricopeptide repeat protein [Streptomyces rhizosphaerihabitans]|uniref:tetratricopeptide repeat protein n=1 Tax=Streptomyces rhizosphaerihabitans TaxID=1266770 RepID=UPI0021C1D086|nr:tetratricopeptide repeat protein [Streptomyces rhizosphaerihabitans]MCT9007742.1 tetratricopeptide repeat protein [Streptomyces rhizosphaerihabitans]
MGLVRTLLPLSREAARLSPRPGRQWHGAALMRCLTPGWVLLRPASPQRRVAWAEEAVAVYRALVETEEPSPRHRDLLARSLVQHASALLLVGRCEESCTAMDASLAVPGARWSPARRTHLLHLRAQAQFDLGRRDDALVSAGECVSAYRSLLPTRRDRALGGLPGALRTYALVSAALDRTEESVAAYEECAGLLRTMSVRELGRVALLRVRVLSELTNRLRALGRYEEALSVGLEARDATDPITLWASRGTVRPVRVRLLVDLARCLEATGDLPAARTSAEKAVDEARTLTGRDRRAGESLLITALDCLADQLGALGEPGAESIARRETVDVSDALVAERPDVYDPLLATCLERLADCHKAAGDVRAAVWASEREVAVRRRAANLDPAGHEPQLAAALSDLSSIRQDDGDLDRAIGDAREAVALTRRLAESDWSAHHSLTARRLRVLGRALRCNGDHEAAVACYAESESILGDESAGPGRDRHAADLAVTRSGLALALEAAARAHLADGRTDEAVTALCSLLALTRRTDRTGVHVRCLRAFALARAEHRDTVVSAWTRATGEDFPTFVYRWSGTGSKDRLPDGN